MTASSAPATPLGAALAEWACALSADVVPVPAVTRHLLDALGCALASARTGAGRPALAVATADGAGPCAVPGTALRVPTPAAALATGALIHALDYDDTHAGGLVHASAPVVATALAVGQAHQCDGRAVLRAVAVGLEVICRLAAAVPHGFHRNGFHATSVCGAPASALVAALLSDADPLAAAHAIGIAVSTAAGSLEFLSDGAMTKQLHPGLAAQSGITAARLAAAGATGPATALEGRHGLFRLYTGDAPDITAVLEGLGDRWECERITLKPYPACQLVHASLDAVEDLRVRHGNLDPESVVAVEARVHPDAVDVVCEPQAAKHRPRTPYDAKFSLPWTIAAMLVDGQVVVDTFAADQLDREDLAALARRVRHVVERPGALPAASAPGHVVVHTADGRALVGQVPASRGGPESPLDDAAVAHKFAANVGDSATAEAVRRAVEALPHAPDLGELLAATAARR